RAYVIASSLPPGACQATASSTRSWSINTDILAAARLEPLTLLKEVVDAADATLCVPPFRTHSGLLILSFVTTTAIALPPVRCSRNERRAQSDGPIFRCGRRLREATSGIGRAWATIRRARPSFA